MSLLGEIKRRKVFQVAAVYAVVAWLVIQVVDVVNEPLNLPDWLDAVVIVLLAVGFPIAVILAWAFDLTPQGVKADSGMVSRSVAPHSGHRLTVIIQGLVLLAVGFLVLDQYILDAPSDSSVEPLANTDADLRAVNRFAFDLPQGQSFNAMGRSVIAISPNGRQIAYNTFGGLYLRTMGELDAHLISGTDVNSTSPVFSPDGQEVAFHHGGSRNWIERVGIGGGTLLRVAEVAWDPRGLSWETDGTILFGGPEGVLRVSENGGIPEVIIEAREEEQINGPRLLPDGDSVLFTSNRSTEEASYQENIVAQSLTTGERTVIVEDGSDARYIPTGHLIYASGDQLFGREFDHHSLTVTGDAVPLVQGVQRANARGGPAHFSVSNDGTLVYVAGGQQDISSLIWVDRQGGVEVLGVPPGNYAYPRLSPDGSRIALDDRNTENDVRIWNFATQTLSRLTVGEDGGEFPVWSAEGTHVAFDSNSGDIRWKAANNTGQVEVLVADPSITTDLHPYFISPSGELVFHSVNPETQGDISMIVIGQDTEPVPLLNSIYNERNAVLSPDGRWIAYQSDETGQYEIYVRPFPNVNDNVWQASNNGGRMPLWSRDGKELFYLTRGPQRLFSVSVDPTEADFRILTRSHVIDWPYAGTFVRPGRPYDVSFDGEQFLALTWGSGEQTARIIIVENWFTELDRLMPTGE